MKSNGLERSATRIIVENVQVMKELEKILLLFVWKGRVP